MLSLNLALMYVKNLFMTTMPIASEFSFILKMSYLSPTRLRPKAVCLEGNFQT